MTVAAERLCAAPLLASFEDAALAAVAGLMREVALPAGCELIRQGDAADGAWLLESGAFDVVRKLPGGGEIGMATLGPGALVGEASLLRDAPRTATVRARVASRALFLDRRLFRASCDRLEPAALDLARAILAGVAARVREVERRAAAALSGAADDGPGAAPPSTEGPEPAFAWRAFLPILPCFRHFDPVDLASLADALRPFELPAGAPVFAQGGTADGIVVVARGALECGFRAGGALHGVSVLGPGELAGLPSALDGGSVALACEVREPAALLRLEGETFGRLYAGRSRASLAMIDAVAEALLRAQRRAGAAVARTLGLERASRLAAQSRSG